MSAQSQAGPAWQPFTFNGVARFAGATLGRLLVVQGIAALLAGAVVAFFCLAALFPPITMAVAQLPEKAAIRGGWLEWPSDAPVELAGNRFVSLRINAGDEPATDTSTDLQIVLERTRLRVRSLSGELVLDYSPRLNFPLGRSVAEPWWGAWKPTILVLAALGSGAGVLFSWWLLGATYAIPLQLLAFYSDRKLSLAAAWRLANAALLPGAILMTVAIVFHTIGRLNLAGVVVAFGVHLMVGWVYLVGAISSLPRPASHRLAPPNPFAP